jgi:hypothetical protein
LIESICILMSESRTKLLLLSLRSTSAPSSSFPRVAGPFPVTRQVVEVVL